MNLAHVCVYIELYGTGVASWSTCIGSRISVGNLSKINALVK